MIHALLSSDKTPDASLLLNHYYSHAGLGKATQQPQSLYYRASAFGNSSHRHADQGNIALFDHDNSVLIPTGNYGYRFGSRHHKEWTRQTIALNLPLIGKQGQKLDAPNAIGQVIHRQSESNYHTITLDLSKSYAAPLEHFYRTLVLVKAFGLIVVDSISLGEEKTLNWRLHSTLDATLSNDGHTTLLTHPCNANVPYQCRLLSHADVPLTQTQGYSDELTIPTSEIESDASKKVVHLNWQLPESREYKVIACCIKKTMPFPQLRRSSSDSEDEAVLELVVQQQIISMPVIEKDALLNVI